MLKVLIVDDDKTKQSKIEEVIREHAFGELDIRIALNQAMAFAELREANFDLMILDINLPRSAESQAVRNGGIQLLRAIDKHKEFNSPQHVVGLTGYAELAQEHEALFNSTMRFLITYETSNSAWRTQLSTLVVNIVAAKNESDGPKYQTDLAILTALQTPELDAVLNLNVEWNQLPQKDGDAFCFHQGTLETAGRKLSVVAASATRMGMPAATVLTCQTIDRFRPRYVGMSGIAAGVKGQFGDVLVADRTWDYGSGKSKSVGRFRKRTEFEPDPHQVSTDDGLLSKVALFRSQNSEITKRFVDEWPNDIEDIPKIRIGPVASGAAVLENRPAIDSIKRNNRKLIGIEMETFGVYLAASLAPSPRPLVFSAKSICDFGDDRKSDDMQEFAAYMSARFVFEFAIQQLFVKHQS